MTQYVCIDLGKDVIDTYLILSVSLIPVTSMTLRYVSLTSAVFVNKFMSPF